MYEGDLKNTNEKTSEIEVIGCFCKNFLLDKVSIFIESLRQYKI